MRSVVFSNDSRQNAFIKSVLECGVKPVALITKTPFNTFFLFFHSFTKGTFVSHKNKVGYPSCFLAMKYGVKVLDYTHISQEKIAKFLISNSVQYGFVFIFPMLRDKILASVSAGLINFHPGYLPNNRGASPANWVILNRQPRTGYTIHRINNKIDAGEILHQQAVELTGEETTQTLNSHLMNLGTTSFIQIITRIRLGLKLKAKPNILSEGSYQKPFNKQLNYFSEENTKDEIIAIVRASSGKTYSALYAYRDNDLPILDVFEVGTDTGLNLNTDLVITSKDGHQLLLIQKSKY